MKLVIFPQIIIIKYLIASAYIFYFNGIEWTEQSKLQASDFEPDDFFGSAVDIWGNFAIVGAPLKG